MSSTVFANGNAIACKSGSDKVVAAAPDVCLSPPSPPAGPLPVPYPLFSNSGDTTKGSKSVKIAGEEVMLRDKSYYKTCTGDEAATKSLGQGVVTHTITGKVYFIAWSMDVNVEGENVVRHMDMTTSNHASPMGNDSAPSPGLETQTVAATDTCTEILAKFPVVPYNQGCPDTANGTPRTGHHLIPNSAFQVVNGRAYGAAGNIAGPPHPAANYSTGAAPTVCVSGEDKGAGDHAAIHDAFDPKMRAGGPNSKWTWSQCRQAAKEGLMESKGMSDAQAECIMVEMDKYYEDELGCKPDTELRASDQGQPSSLSPGGGAPQVPTNPPLPARYPPFDRAYVDPIASEVEKAMELYSNPNFLKFLGL